MKKFPRSINWHLTSKCNAKCRYCFSKNLEGGSLSFEDGCKLLKAICEAGCQKINFAGGEPTLDKNLAGYIKDAHELGMTTSIVTNGCRLAELLDELPVGVLDWVGLSIDSSKDDVNKKVGRGGPSCVDRIIECAQKARAYGAKVKLNITVSKFNIYEDMTDLISKIRPDRFKIFQVLRVEGQNDLDNEDVWITDKEFSDFAERHKEWNPVVETGEDIVDSYAMIDPLGHFFGDTGGVHRNGLSILEAGSQRAIESVGFDHEKLVARGGNYEWFNNLGRFL